MPKLISLYIQQVAIGFAIAAAFVGALLWFDVNGLRGLIFGSDVGLIALFMLWISNGIVFAGVQFGIRIMMMAEDDTGPRGGKRQPIKIDYSKPVPVQAEATKRSVVPGRK